MDLLIILILMVMIVVLGAVINSNQLYRAWAPSYKLWNIEELFMVLGVLALGFGFHAARRWRDLEHEIAERKSHRGGAACL